MFQLNHVTVVFAPTFCFTRISRIRSGRDVSFVQYFRKYLSKKTLKIESQLTLILQRLKPNRNNHILHPIEAIFLHQFVESFLIICKHHLFQFNFPHFLQILLCRNRSHIFRLFSIFLKFSSEILLAT